MNENSFVAGLSSGHATGRYYDNVSQAMEALNDVLAVDGFYVDEPVPGSEHYSDESKTYRGLFRVCESKTEVPAPFCLMMTTFRMPSGRYEVIFYLT